MQKSRRCSVLGARIRQARPSGISREREVGVAFLLCDSPWGPQCLVPP